METFERMQTKSIGLWWHPESNKFISGAINLSKLKKFKGTVCITVKKNRYYNNGQNSRPNYLLWIYDAKSNNPREIDIEEMESDEEDEYSFTRGELQDLINRVACDAGGESECGMHLVEDYL